MSTPFTGALSLCNLASVGIFGIVLSAAFCELEWTRQRKLLLAGCTVLMLALQGIVSLWWSTSFARYLYPVITHLPLVILLAAMTRKALWSLIAVLTAYLCCQLRRWAALLVIALFPTGGTALQDAAELVVTLPLLLALLVPAALLIKEPHISATALIVMTCIILIFVGGVNLKQFLLIGVIGAAGALLLVSIMSRNYDYIQKRIQSWVDPFADSQGNTWQTCQSLIAIGSGGLFGLGLGESRQKYLYLPVTKNDFVFSIVCEELGLVGALTVVLLFTPLVIRGFYIAMRAKDKFGMLMAIGLTSHIGLQAFFNIAVVSNLIPNTGISLPFFSYGGTALILQLAEMGIVLNISRVRYQSPQRAPAAERAPQAEVQLQGGNA